MAQGIAKGRPGGSGGRTPSAVARLAARRRNGPFSLRMGDYAAVVAAGLAQAVCLVAFVYEIHAVLKAFRPAATGVLAGEGYRVALVRIAVLGVLSALLGIFRAWEFGVAERAGYEVVRRLRMEMFAHLQRMLPGQLRHRARGGLLLRMTGDLSMLRMWLSRGVLEGLSALIVLVAGLGVIAWYSVWLALAVLTVYVLGAALSLFNGRAMREATRSMRRRRSLLIGNVDEQIGALAVTQVHGRERGEHARLSRQNDSLTRALVRVAVLRGRLRGLAATTGLLASSSVLGVGLVESQRATVGVEEVVAAAIVARLLSRPVRTLGLMHDYWHRGMVSQGKISDFLASSARPAELEQLPRVRVRRGHLTLEGAGVDGRLLPATVEAKPGMVVALVGPAGSGADVVLELLTRQVHPTTGRVVVDGQDLEATCPASMARHVGAVAAHLPLMRGSIQRNLTYGHRDASPEEIQRVYLSIGLDGLVERIGPEGVRFWLTERGENLERADRQVLSIGRALMGNPTFLVLDDPLAGVDEDRRATVREAILRHKGTVLWATTSPDDVALADEVWTFQGGALIDQCSGAEYADRLWLMTTGGDPWGSRSTV